MKKGRPGRHLRLYDVDSEMHRPSREDSSEKEPLSVGNAGQRKKREEEKKQKRVLKKPKSRDFVGKSGDVPATKETSRKVAAIRGQCWACQKFKQLK